jgi:hypothetical protein
MEIRMTRHMTRRAFGTLAGTLLLSSKVVAQTEKTETVLLSRPIPGSGERGIGLAPCDLIVDIEDIGGAKTNRENDGINLWRCGKRTGRGHGSCRPAGQALHCYQARDA